MFMLLVSELLRWWYSDGWRRCAQKIADRLDQTIDYFSFGLLIKTLFAPFRQISAGKVDGSLDVKFRAMIDKLFSRVIGAIVRLIILLIGTVVIAIQAVAAVVLLVLWSVMPVLPFAGIILMSSGLPP